MNPIQYMTVDQTIGRTPLVRLQRIEEQDNARRGNVLLAKLEGNNPAGSVKDRPALAMIARAEARGDIRPGDTLIEATSGNTGIALAMAAAIRGYRMVLIMPDNLSVERRQSMKAYGAELILVSKAEGMEGARDLADRMQAEGRGRVLDQFANDDNWAAHYESTGPEIWDDTGGRVTHFVSAMGTTGTITGVSRYLKERNPGVVIVGAQPTDGSSIPHPQVAGLHAEDLQPCAGRPHRGGHSIGCGDGPPARRRGGNLRRHLGRWRLLHRAAHRARGGERNDRLRGLRPRRPLPVHRRLSRVSPAADGSRPGPG
jgi:cysteine synthase B